MQSVGLICEYNPFHNGHIYHIEQTRKLFPDACLILCLNGYFLQRGEVSILSKEEKTKIALQNHVDLVVELPAFYGTQGADFFAKGALTILNALGISHLVFGSETTDLDHFTKIIQKQLNNDLKIIKSKDNYPTRLSKTLDELQLEPNDILAVSYLKTIQKMKYPITPVPLKRTSVYHDLTSKERVVSASNIRAKIHNSEDISHYLPKESLDHLIKIDESKLFTLLKYKILIDHHLDELMDVTEGLDHKLKCEIVKVDNLSDLLKALKSKRYTFTRTQRMLIHVLLGIKKEREEIPISYLHILGFNEVGSNYLKKQKKNILLSTKVDYQSPIYKYEFIAAKLYDIITNTNSSKFDVSNQPIKYIQP